MRTLIILSISVRIQVWLSSRILRIRNGLKLHLYLPGFIWFYFLSCCRPAAGSGTLSDRFAVVQAKPKVGKKATGQKQKNNQATRVVKGKGGKKPNGGKGKQGKGAFSVPRNFVVVM
jgi:hypothetical protein